MCVQLARTLEKRLDAQQLDMERMRSSPTRSLSPSRRDPEWPTEYDQFAPIDPLSHKRPVSPTVHHHYHPVVTEAVRPVSPLYGTDYEQQQATLQPPSQVVYMPAPPTVVQLPPPAVHYSDATAYPYPTSITSAEPSFVQPPSGYDASSSSSSRWYERDDGNRRTVSSRQQPVQGVMHSSPTHSRRSLVRDLDGDIDGGDVDDGWGTTDVTDVHPIQFQPPSEERREMRRQGKSRGRKSSTSAVGKRKWFWPPWGGKT